MVGEHTATFVFFDVRCIVLKVSVQLGQHNRALVCRDSKCLWIDAEGFRGAVILFNFKW